MLGVVVADGGGISPIAASTVAAAALLCGLVARAPATRIAMAALACAGSGAAGLAGPLEAAGDWDSDLVGEALVRGRVCEIRDGPGWRGFELCEVRPVRSGTELPDRLRWVEGVDALSGSWLERARVGDRLRAQLRLRPLGGLRNPGATPVRGPEATRRRGIGAEARLAHPALAVRVDARRSPQRIAAWRRALSRRLDSERPGVGLLKALALGDRSGISGALWDAVARLGLAHLLAVSGLHLALVAGLAYGILRRALVAVPILARRFDVRAFALSGALLVAVGYGLLAGWGIPVRRAVVFLAIAALSAATRRPLRPLHLLGAAAMVVLAREPAAIFDLGPQLSFAASGALIVSVPRPTSRQGHVLWEALVNLVRTTSTCVVVSAPLIAWHGGGSGPAGLLANSIAVPWTAFALLPAALLAAAAAACAPDGLFDLLLGGAAGIAAWTERSTLAVAPLVPPLAAGAVPAFWALALCVGIAVLAVRSRSTGLRVGLALAVVTVLRFAPVPAIAPAPPRVIALDVGQGDAVIIQGERGAVLVDGGRAGPRGPDLGARAVVPSLRALGIRSLDLVVASHADLDHRGGLPAVLGAVPVGALWLPPGGGVDPDFGALRSAARHRGVPVVERAAGDAREQFGDLEVRPLWPPRARTDLSRNERSLVVQVAVAGRRVLVSGDIGETAERALVSAAADLRADVLKLPHHGSRRSASASFLAAVAPEISLLSAACGSRSGLPNLDSIERIRRAGGALFWTGRDGAVLVQLGPRLLTRSWGLARPCGTRPLR